MAQANSQVRSTSDKSSWKAIITIGLPIAVILLLLGVFSTPKAAVAPKPQSASVHKTTTVVNRQTHTLSSPDLVHEILRTHPHPNVRGEFYQMIVDNKMGISWYTGSSAAFVLIPVELIGTSGGTPTDDLFPALFVDPKILRPELRAVAQLILYHEFVHYEQWRDGRIPEDAFVLKPLASRASLQDTCTKKWYAEAEAYHRACAFARETGLIEQIDEGSQTDRVCRATEETFTHILRENLVHSGDRVAAKCSAVWTTM